MMLHFPNEKIQEYAVNIIVDNMFSQVDSEGFTITQLLEILDWSKDDLAVKTTSFYCTTSRGDRRMCHTICGLKLLVKWSYITKTWIS